MSENYLSAISCIDKTCNFSSGTFICIGGLCADANEVSMSVKVQLANVYIGRCTNTKKSNERWMKEQWPNDNMNRQMHMLNYFAHITEKLRSSIITGFYRYRIDNWTVYEDCTWESLTEWNKNNRTSPAQHDFNISNTGKGECTFQDSINMNFKVLVHSMEKLYTYVSVTWVHEYHDAHLNCTIGSTHLMFSLQLH